MDLFRRLFSQSNAKPDESDPASVYERHEETAIDRQELVETTPITPSSIAETATLVPDGATRPLPPETVISSSNEHLIFGQATDVGMVRTNNQDAVYSFIATGRSADQRPDFGLFIVA